MEFVRGELMAKLTTIRPGLAARSQDSKYDHFFFSGKRLMTKNERVCISVPMETDFSGGVLAETFYDVLKTLDSEKVEIVGDQKIVVKTEKTETEIPLLSNEQIQDMVNSDKNMRQQIEGNEQGLPEHFAEAIGLCKDCVSRDSTAGSSTCIMIHDKNVVGSDSHQLAWYELPESVDARFFISKAEATVLSKIEKLVKYSLSDWAHFLNEEGTTFSTHIYSNETYPEWEKVFTSLAEVVAIEFDPTELTKCLDLCTITSETTKNDLNVDIQVSNLLMTISSENEKGKNIARMEVRYKGSEEIKFSLNPKMLKIGMGLSASPTLRFCRIGGKIPAAAFFSGPFKYLMALKG